VQILRITHQGFGQRDERARRSKGKNQYITQAIRRQIQQGQREALDKTLEEGYRSTQLEGLALSQEFEATDLEGWDNY
jgi:hypothetical protein